MTNELKFLIAVQAIIDFAIEPNRDNEIKITSAVGFCVDAAIKNPDIKFIGESDIQKLVDKELANDSFYYTDNLMFQLINALITRAANTWSLLDAFKIYVKTVYFSKSFCESTNINKLNELIGLAIIGKFCKTRWNND